jgi:hypothetical protein
MQKCRNKHTKKYPAIEKSMLFESTENVFKMISMHQDTGLPQRFSWTTDHKDNAVPCPISKHHSL